MCESRDCYASCGDCYDNRQLEQALEDAQCLLRKVPDQVRDAFHAGVKWHMARIGKDSQDEQYWGYHAANLYKDKFQGVSDG